MKKLALFFILFFASYVSAQTVITMEEEGGVFKIPCVINGARAKFIFDTGASNVCLSESFAEYLYENGYIKEDDIIGAGQSSIADGRIVDHLRLNIRDIEIATLHLKNVEAVVIVGQKGSMLLGQSAIKALGPVTVDGNRLIINNSPGLSDEARDRIEISAFSYYAQKDYYQSSIEFAKLDRFDLLNSWSLMHYTLCKWQIKQYSDAIELGERWLRKYEFDDFSTYERGQILRVLAGSYRNKKDYDKSIAYMLKKISMIHDDFESLALHYLVLADTYNDANEFALALSYQDKAIETMKEGLNYSGYLGEFRMYQDRNQDLADCYYSKGLLLYSHDYNLDEAERCVKTAAKMGLPEAISFCKRNEISLR